MLVLAAKSLSRYHAILFQMKLLVAIVTTLHVLAHGVFGCCDQVAHSTATVAHECLCHHADQDAHHSAETAQLIADDHPPHVPHECVHDSCHWVVGDSPLKLNLLHLSLGAMCPADGLHTIEVVQANSFWSNLDAHLISAPPVRLHLALGVILV